MEGGVGWSKQIEEALDHVRFLVIVITPAAMQSEMTRKEWRYARQRSTSIRSRGAPTPSSIKQVCRTGCARRIFSISTGNGKRSSEEGAPAGARSVYGAGFSRRFCAAAPRIRATHRSTSTHRGKAREPNRKQYRSARSWRLWQ